MAKYSEDEAKLFSEVHCGRIRDRHEIQAGKFQSYIRKQLFVWLVEFFHHKHCQRRLNQVMSGGLNESMTNNKESLPKQF